MIEKKLVTLAEVKFAAPDAPTKTFSGYGAVFGNSDYHGDVIAKGAFSASINNAPAPLMLLNHDPFSLPIGRWIDVQEDDYGLKLTGEFLDTTIGRDVYTAAKAGAVTGLSIGYRPTEVIMASNPTDPTRILKSVDLLEVSVVTFPANDLARIADVKSLEAVNEFERDLMRIGMTLSEAKSFLANHQTLIEAKYNRAAEFEAARKLLLQLQGEQ